MPIHILKTYIRNPRYKQNYFYVLIPVLYIKYARPEGRDAKLLLMTSCFVKLLEANFHVLAKLDGCQAKIAKLLELL
jgi:hypothetical protein